MTLTLGVLAVLAGIEALLFLPLVWRYRAVLASVLVVALALAQGALWVQLPFITGLAVLGIGVYRIFNLVRVAASKVDYRRLHSMTWHGSWWLAATQSIAIGVAIFLQHVAIDNWQLLLGIAVLQLAGAAVLLATTSRQLRKTQSLATETAYSDHELPSITVCVPARNETDTLAACLESLVASDYPKLEVLVLDDCSQDKTSAAIKAFAHQGVRFLHGTPPPDGWLAKNWAYQQLFEAASSDYLVFCGVDIRFEPQSLRALVATALSRHKAMLCLLPRNSTPPDIHPSHSTLLQPMRYAWELALPRRAFRRPPVLSSCWLVDRQLLRRNGGFTAARRSIDPERALARQATLTDSYAFIQSNATMAVLSQKLFRDQLETAIRTRYPQLRRRPEIVWLVTSFEIICLILPGPLALLSSVEQHWLVATLSGLAFVISNSTYCRIVRLTYRQWLWRALLALPVAALSDILIRHYSMWQYEFGEVYWKGRNVCIPVMEVIPRLPALPDDVTSKS